MVSGGSHFCLHLAIVLLLLPGACNRPTRLSAAVCANFYLLLDTSIACYHMCVSEQQVAAMIVNNPAIRQHYDRIGW